MELLSDFWSVMLWLFWAYVYIAYLFAIVIVLGDVFRDRSLNGWLKAVWVIFLVFVPFLTVLVYLIARGNGLSQRMGRGLNSESEDPRGPSDSGAGSSPADEVAKAHALLRSGAITHDEFEVIKTKALA